jgi:hypothetical protein
MTTHAGGAEEEIAVAQYVGLRARRKPGMQAVAHT